MSLQKSLDMLSHSPQSVLKIVSGSKAFSETGLCREDGSIFVFTWALSVHKVASIFLCFTEALAILLACS